MDYLLLAASFGTLPPQYLPAQHLPAQGTVDVAQGTVTELLATLL